MELVLWDFPFSVLSALHVFSAVIFWIKSINAPSSAHLSANLGLGNEVNRRECFYFFPVLCLIPAVLISLVYPVWTVSTKATLWSELLNMCEKQVADLQGFLVETLGQRGKNWVHVCNILQTLLVKNLSREKTKKCYLKAPLTTLLTGLDSAQLLFWWVSSVRVPAKM